MLYIGLYFFHLFFPALSSERVELRVFYSDIFTESRYFGGWDKYLCIFLVFQLDIFFFDSQDFFFYDSYKLSDSMVYVYDIVSISYLEQEIYILTEFFLYSRFYKYLREYIITNNYLIYLLSKTFIYTLTHLM